MIQNINVGHQHSLQVDNLQWISMKIWHLKQRQLNIMKAIITCWWLEYIFSFVMFVVRKRTTVLKASHIPHKLLVSYDQFIFPTLVVIYSLHWFHSVSVQGLLVFKLVINFFPSMEYNACFDKLITTSRSFTSFFFCNFQHLYDVSPTSCSCI